MLPFSRFFFCTSLLLGFPRDDAHPRSSHRPSNIHTHQGLGPYAKPIKQLEEDLKKIAKNVNDLKGTLSVGWRPLHSRFL